MLPTGTVSTLVASGAVLLGWALGLDYSAKLFVMTFLLVIMGAEQRSDAFLVALTRISGIVLGVLLSLALSVCVFPKSASHQVLMFSIPPTRTAEQCSAHVPCPTCSL